jgi:hypothetical protein
MYVHLSILDKVVSSLYANFGTPAYIDFLQLNIKNDSKLLSIGNSVVIILLSFNLLVLYFSDRYQNELLNSNGCSNEKLIKLVMTS